jgi:GT2 family glycosyltransferase
MLAEALASVVAQTDGAWRAVVADDGDGAPVEGDPRLPRDARIAYVRTAARTAGGARNAAVVFGEARLLRGPAALVAFLDDDDLWRGDHLARARAALAAAPDATFVHAAAVTRGPDGREAPYHARGKGPLAGAVLDALLVRDVVATSSAVVRGPAFTAVGRFREDLSHGEDWDLWLRLAAQGPAAFVDAPTAVHRDHGGNVSHDLAAKARDQAVVAASWWRRRHLLSPTQRATLRATLVRLHRRHVRRLLADGRASRAELASVAREAWREAPSIGTGLARLAARFGRRGR